MCALYADTIVCIHIHNSIILQEELAKERNWNVKTPLDKVKGSKRRILLSVTHHEVNSSYGECVCVCAGAHPLYIQPTCCLFPEENGRRVETWNMIS